MSTPAPRPKKPSRDETVWHRGWEIRYISMAQNWAGAGWVACKDGRIQGATYVAEETFEKCLREVDNFENKAP